MAPGWESGITDITERFDFGRQEYVEKFVMDFEKLPRPGQATGAATRASHTVKVPILGQPLSTPLITYYTKACL